MRKAKPLHDQFDWHVGLYMMQAFKAGRWPLTTAFNRIKRSKNP